MRISDWSSDVCSSDLCDEYLRDVERTFHVLDGREQPDRYAGIIGAIDQERTGLERKAWVAESEFFRAKAFKNGRSEEHTSELQSLMRSSYAVFCLKKQLNSSH